MSEVATKTNAAVLHANSPEGPGPAPGGQIACPGCGRASGPDRKFCANCGQSLWEPCLNCKALSPIGERFCGTCGANLQAAYETEAQKLEEHLERARRAQSECRFLDALVALRAVERCEVARLRPKVEAAARLIEEFKEQKQALEAEAATAGKRAAELLGASNFAAAAELLERVPERLRTPEQNDLLEQARQRLAEIAALQAEIKADLAAQRYVEVAPKAQRLLGLEPGNTAVQTLLGKLAKRMVESAAQRLAAHQYEEAQAFLDATPEAARDAAYHKLRQEVDEIAWLTAAQRTMPLADATLVAISERLVKAVPNHPTAAKIHQRLQQCLAGSKEREGRLQPPAWAKPPASTALGAPVEALYGFQRLAGPGLASAALKAAPTAFYPAVGLALAALGRGAMAINLLPPVEEGFLARFVKLGGATPVSAAWGVDLSSSGLKAVRLTLADDGERVELDRCIHLTPDASESRPANPDEARQLRERLVQTFKDEQTPDDKEPLAVGLSGAKTLGRFVELPPVPADKIADAVRYEAPHQIPFPLDQLYWGYQVLNEETPTEAAELAVNRLVLVAAKRHHVEEQLSHFTAAGLQPKLVVSDAVALHNYLVFDQLPSDAKASPARPVVLVDSGVDCTNVVISTRHDLWFRTIPQGSGDLNGLLIKAFKLTYQQAEQLKRQPALARRLSRLYEVLDPWIDGFVGEVGRTLAAYANLNRGTILDRILGAGGGFQLPGLLRAMRQPG